MLRIVVLEEAALGEGSLAAQPEPPLRSSSAKGASALSGGEGSSGFTEFMLAELKAATITSAPTISSLRAERRPPMSSMKAACRTVAGSLSKNSPKWPSPTLNSSLYEE
ncbi:hypothetical protein Adt_37868 [Abeliophyllum distichum]|uniref:Uncharacterized protein n=1 Tax=Abeliophyllum distichum TaxID=126358 RepID=A0ABD1Q1L1_9LAMI